MNDFIKHDGSKNPLHLLPTVALERIGEVLDAGQKKYAPNNWRKIDKRSRYYSAALRHLFAWNRGEDKDPETSLKHLAHAACSLLFLLEAEELGLGEDDRPTSKKQVPSKEKREMGTGWKKWDGWDVVRNDDEAIILTQTFKNDCFARVHGSISTDGWIWEYVVHSSDGTIQEESASNMIDAISRAKHAVEQ